MELKEYTDFKAAYGKHLTVDDWQAVDIVAAVVATHKIHGNPLWLRIIGASGSGKTELLRSLMGNDYCEACESITPSSIRRGYKPGGQELPKMLDRLNDKLVITKEFGVMLTKNKDTTKEIYGLLRSVHDGQLDADYGSTQSHITQVTWFDWLLASTGYVDRQSLLELLLGSRFIDLRWGMPLDKKGMTLKAMSNDKKLAAMRKELNQAMSLLITKIEPTCDDSSIDDEFLYDITNFATTARTPVEREGSGRMEIVAPPEEQSPARMAQGFRRIAVGLKMLGIDDCKPHLIRLMWDGIPPIRSAVIRLKVANVGITGEEIANAIGVSEGTVSRTLQDLKVSGMNKLYPMAVEFIKGVGNEVQKP